MPHIGIDRRTFVGRAAALVLTLAGSRASAASAAPPATALRVAAILPEGDTALAGVRLGAHEVERAASLFGTTFELHQAHASGPSATARAAEDVIARHAVHVLIGGADAAAADALADVARDRQILFFNVGTPADAIRRLCHPMMFHLQPSAAVIACARAAVDDVPPDAQAVVWHPSLFRYGAAQINERFRDASGTGMDGRAWAGWMAVRIAFDAAQRAGSTSPAALAEHLASPRAIFDGHKGMQLSFHPDTHELRQPLYVTAGDRVIGQAPSPGDSGDAPHAVLLDRLADPEARSCPA